uniref:Uncharacterized protein n=1 Tax=Anguilla anguilla TaxID=7936 RepID=A0A0E9PP98_ANGAN
MFSTKSYFPQSNPML